MAPAHPLPGAPAIGVKQQLGGKLNAPRRALEEKIGSISEARMRDRGLPQSSRSWKAVDGSKVPARDYRLRYFPDVQLPDEPCRRTHAKGLGCPKLIVKTGHRPIVLTVLLVRRIRFIERTLEDRHFAESRDIGNVHLLSHRI